ncbi:MAG: ankyrin repeat domain-containing protein [Alphaproteobacteria bacterium]|nr:ankyrin repeat domain-containing protein [Alphaproteobacteria bacterium]
MAWTKEGRYREALRGLRVDNAKSIDAVIACLDEGVNPDAWYKKGVSLWRHPVYRALNMDDQKAGIKLMAHLLKAGISMEKHKQMLELTLRGAIEQDRPEVVSMLFDAGFDRTVTDRHFNKPFASALKNGSYKVAAALIEMGEAQEGVLVEPDRDPPLFCVLNKMIDVPEGLVQKIAALPGQGVNAKKYGDPLLHSLVRGGAVQAVKTLIELPGHNIDPKGWEGQAMVVATRDYHPQIFRLLVDAGASLEKGQECLISAVRSEGVDIVDAVLALAEEKQVEFDLDQALLRAARCYSPKIVERLVKAGANIECRDERGRTPIMIAVQSGRKEVPQKLHDLGAKIDVRDGDGMSVIDHAQRENCDVPFIRAGQTATPEECSVDVKISRSLTCTFNFWTQQVIYQSDKGIAVQSFSDMPRQEAIAEAYEMLKEKLQGKKAPEYSPAPCKVSQIKPFKQAR